MKEWINEVRNSLRTCGYYYQPEFCAKPGDVEPVVTAAKLLGRLHIPLDSDSRRSVIRTQPSSSAPPWRPFDRHAPIRWHNDFSTRVGRPQLSLSWILREDPAGPLSGAWYVASAAEVLGRLRRSRAGSRMFTDLSERAEPFGYRDAGGCRSFRVIFRVREMGGRTGLRFYGPALEDGAWLRFGKIPARTQEIVARIEEAADIVRKVLPAKTGSLLIVHNCLSLHDRSPQTVTGHEGRRRQAELCFVERLHKPLYQDAASNE